MPLVQNEVSAKRHLPNSAPGRQRGAPKPPPHELPHVQLRFAKKGEKMMSRTPNRGKIEMKLSILEQTQPATLSRNTKSDLVIRARISHDSITRLLQSLVENKLVEPIVRPAKTLRYHRKTKLVQCYIITPAGQQALESVRQSGLME